MAHAPSPYQKLTGTGLRRTAFGFSATRSRLWLGEDHLLSVDFTVATEEYRRFYFRDIEAVVVRHTSNRQWWNWILGTLVLLTAGPFFIAWRSDGNGGFMVASLGCAIFWLIFIAINSARGATCQTHIRTAVQLESLPTLGRLPVTRKVLARLVPLIRAAQGEATPEELAAAPWMAADAGGGAGLRTGMGSQKVRAEKGTLHGALFGLLLAEGIATAFFYAVFHQALSLVGMLLMLAGCIVCVIALTRQRNTDLPGVVRTMAKCAMGYYVLKCAAGFGFSVTYTVHHQGAPLVTGLEMVDEPGFLIASLISGGIAAIIGLIGLLALLNHLRNRSAAPAA